MKLPTIRFVFDRKNVADLWRGKKENKVKGLVQVEVYYDGKRKYYSTGIKLLKGQWDDTKHVINHPDSLPLNQQLSIINTRIQDTLAEIQRKGSKFALCSLDSIFDDKLSTKDIIVDCRAYSARLQECGRAYKTCNVTNSMIYNLERWIASKKIRTLPPDEFSVTMLIDFDTFLKAKGLKETTIISYHQKLRQVFNQYLREGVITVSPYRDFVFKEKCVTRPKYLTQEEFDKVKEYQPTSDGLSYIKDLFLFQAYTGLSYCDAIAIDKSSQITKAGNRYVLRDTRIKTHTNFTIVLMPKAKEILDRHGGCLARYQFAQIARLMRRMGLATLGRSLSTHVARHTFATLALSNGVPIEYVSRMLGHTNITTTQRYARVLEQDVIAQFDKLQNL